MNEQPKVPFEAMLANFMQLSFKEHASKEDIAMKVKAYTELLQYVHNLEHTIQKVKRAVGED